MTSLILRQQLPPGYRRYVVAQADMLAHHEACAPVSPQLARTTADGIVRYWEHAYYHGTINPHFPLLVIDFSPGRGGHTWLTENALSERIEASALPLPKPTYIACSTQTEHLDALLVHPYLSVLSTRRSLRFARWSPPRGENASFQWLSDLRPHGNPIVVLAHGLLETLAQSLYYIQHDMLYEAYLSNNGEGRCSYAWQPLTREEANKHPSGWLLNHYRQRLNNTPVPIPQIAIDFFDWLNTFSEGRYLFLGSEHGIREEDELCKIKHASNGRLAVPQRLPLNLHGLQAFWQRHGELASMHTISNTTATQLTVFRDRQLPGTADLFSALRESIEHVHPDDGAQLRRLASKLPGGTNHAFLSLLKQTGYDPQLLSAIADPLRVSLRGCDKHSRTVWKQALEKTWDNYFPSGETDLFYTRLSSLAIDLKHWELAKACLSMGSQMFGEDPDDLFLLACCNRATGQNDVAVNIVLRALRIQPDHAQCLKLYRELSV